ncbi:MAG: DUF885 domain-containing protein [Acidobacteriota bacterium]|nr:DUF885 domain-containing protein [Acidobacteriota bacterium]
MPDSRTLTAVDMLAERHFAATLELSPVQATDLGLALNQDCYDDFSPDGRAEFADLARRTLAEAADLTPQDEVDRVTLTVLNERLGLQLEIHEADADLLSVNGIASDLHSIREVYDLMPQSSDDDWAMIARRLQAVPEAIDGWFSSQQAAIAAGLPPARRQAQLLAKQCRSWAGAGGYFDVLGDAAGARPASLAADLSAGLAAAKGAFLTAADRIAAELAPRASEVDAVGRERYLLASRGFLGTSIDIDQSYAWGLDEVARVQAEMAATARQIVPGGTIRQAQDALDADPAYRLKGTEALRDWMQHRADDAIAGLVAGEHFVIPEPLRRIECRIADTHDGGIYYTPPSEDFTRPGRMWWSVPLGEDEFTTWRELTTVYHEGVPGHHLQHALALASPELNQWRRHGLWVSGHGEGWALYAERLMAELGFLDDPGMQLGLLDSQSLRAARVVIDLGVHCGLPAPESVGGGDWTFDKAWRYFNAHVSMPLANARFEVQRYHGWPGQAPSYRIGEQCWLDLREQVRARRGETFDLAEFHSVALALGTMGLDTLRDAVLAAFADA